MTTTQLTEGEYNALLLGSLKQFARDVLALSDDAVVDAFIVGYALKDDPNLRAGGGGNFDVVRALFVASAASLAGTDRAELVDERRAI